MKPEQQTGESSHGGARAFERWRWGVPLVLLATALRLVWVLVVPTVPVGDFATYRESANYLLEYGSLDHGFIYMPGFVLMLAGVAALGGDLLAQKMIGVLLGGLAAAAIFGITSRLADDDRPGSGASAVGVGVGVGVTDSDPSASHGAAALAPRAGLACPCPIAAIATLLYALWPAGVALTSVVGTDVPAASLMLIALWALIAWGDRRPYAAALGFGALMGLAAYVRAVALPLTLMSFGYWALRGAGGRRRWSRVAALTLLSTAATLVVLMPWALRNRRQYGALSFSDQHGGITALIGANPNSEGTYTRALNRMFKDLTGRSVISPPHRETDQLAFDLAKDWTRFELGYAAGLAALKAERLFWSEWHLLYWPIGRPGVLVGPTERWFAPRMAAANAIADTFWYGLCALFAAGIALCIAERRLLMLSLIPFQLALTATYTIFFAEPRYRIPIEMMAFPVAAFALHRLWTLARAGVQAGARGPRLRALTRITAAVTAAVLLFAASASLSAAGAHLRAAHRWAATVWIVDGKPVLAKWRRGDPARGPSPIAGAPNGVHITTGAEGRAAAEVLLAALPAGSFHLDGDIERDDAAAPEGAIRFTLAAAAAAQAQPLADPVALASAARAHVHARFTHSGGPMRLLVQLEGPAGSGVWISTIAIARE